MKKATAAYVQEERRRFGATPRLKAEIRPFDVDLGLGPGLGEFSGCACSEAGTLVLDSNALTARWTSEIQQTRFAQLAVIPSWISLSDYNSSSFFLRSGASSAEVNTKPWVQVELGTKIELESYFQVRIEFSGFIRAWAEDGIGDADNVTAYAVDPGPDPYLSWAVGGEYPGRLTWITLAGLVMIDEGSIADCPNIIASRPAWFHDLRGETHTLILDNRRRQWVSGHQGSLMADGLWHGKEIHLYTGFDLPAGGTSWVKQYVGRIKDIREINDSFTGLHQAKLFSTQLIHDILGQMIGTPATDGTRAPYLAGYYKLRASLTETVPAVAGAVNKLGAGNARMEVIGTPKNNEDLDFVIEAENTGEVMVATFRWSLDNGASWEKAGLIAQSSANPVRLRDGLHVYFVPGIGDDLVKGDRFTFTAYARRTRYLLAGAPFLAVTNLYYNGVEIFDTEVHPDTGEIVLVGATGLVDARVVKSGVTHPVDIIREILTHVGLEDYIDELSFHNARQAVADYQIGVRFENVPAWKAIQEICRTCLLFFWVDADLIYLSAYTGE